MGLHEGSCSCCEIMIGPMRPMAPPYASNENPSFQLSVYSSIYTESKISGKYSCIHVLRSIIYKSQDVHKTLKYQQNRA